MRKLLLPDIDKWQEIFTSLRQHKLRTFLTALSVWWGIFMLVILLGAGKGLQNSAEHDFKDDALNSMYIWTNQTSKPYKGLPAGRNVRFREADYDRFKEKKGDWFKSVSGRYWIPGEFFTTYKNKSLSYNVQSVYPDHKQIELPKVVKGRFINDRDIEQRRKVCTIGQEVANAFFKEDEEPLGEYLKIKGTEYQIVGVFTEQRTREMERIYLPITTVQRIEGTNRVSTLVVELPDVDMATSKAIENKLRADLAAHHKFDPEDEEAIGIWNAAENFQEFQQVFMFIKLFIWFVGLGSIIAGVIGVSNIMLIIVKERTKEIGVRKALGATPWSIVSMIVYEAVFLTSIAGYLGLASGLGLIYGAQQIMEINEIEAEFFRNPEVDMVTIMVAMGILILSGVVSGLIPALQAVRINPVVAMKG